MVLLRENWLNKEVYNRSKTNKLRANEALKYRQVHRSSIYILMANAIPNDLGPDPTTEKVIPDDLAGYQNIVTGTIQEGDVLVYNPSRHKAWAAQCTWGVQIKSSCSDIDVYRKMPCPKVGDHDKDWKEVKAKDWHYVPDGNPLDQKAKTDDGDKPPLANLPWKALRKVSAVQAYGHKKYGSYHNFKLGMEVSRNLSCAIRHISEYMDGNDNDKESLQPHLAHAACRILFALENIEDGVSVDDRFKK